MAGCVVIFIAVVLLIPFGLASHFGSGFSLDTLPAEGHQSWNPAVKCSATLTTIESVIGNKANSNGGATFSGGGFAPGIPDKRSTSPPCVYPANGNVTFVEIHHVKVGSVTDTSGSGTDCARFPNGQFCDTYWNAIDDTKTNGVSNCPFLSSDVYLCTIHMEIDQAWKSAGIAPSLDPAQGNYIDVQGFVYWDDAHVGMSGHSYSGWEIHTISSWKTSSQDFTLSANPSDLVLSVDSSTTAQINIASQGLSAGVSLTVSSSPVVISTLTPTTVTLAPGGSASSTLNIDSKSAVPSTYQINVTGTARIQGATISHTTTVVVNIIDFSITALPGSLSIAAGSQTSSSIQIRGLNGFAGKIALTSRASSPAISATLSPDGVTLSSSLTTASSTLMVESSSQGSYTLMVNGTYGTLTHTAVISVTVTRPVDFTISANPNSLSLQAASSSSATMTLTGLNGFLGNISLTDSVSPTLPDGPTTTLSPSVIALQPGSSGSSTFTLASTISTPPGHTMSPLTLSVALSLTPW